MSADGTYTNALYGFLAILFRELEDLNPEVDNMIAEFFNPFIWFSDNFSPFFARDYNSAKSRTVCACAL